ncbi:MAG: nucleotidyltransferase domain-containing protein [Patescibacteria group bacterium]
MEIDLNQHEQLQNIGARHALRFIILHGSYATGKNHRGSDLDIAVLGTKPLTGKEISTLHGELSRVFGDHAERELDLKSLHGTDPLFRYYVTRDSVLLYGDRTDFNEFKAYATRVFDDLQPLQRLEALMLRKQNRLLTRTTLHHA